MGRHATVTCEERLEAYIDGLASVIDHADLRIPAKATSRSDAWRPPVPIDGDQGGVRAPLGEVGHLRY
jgi:hypothetical protein